MGKEELKKTLEKQLQLLSERSEKLTESFDDTINLYRLASEIRQISALLLSMDAQG